MQVLVSKLAELQRQQRAQDLRDIAGPSAQAAMGNQIRSYVMAPYQQVKDLRTSHEVGNIQGVLDGDLDELMAAFLRWERATQP
jgi:peptide chain release factor 2